MRASGGVRTASTRTFRGITGHKLPTGKRVIDKVTCSLDRNGHSQLTSEGERERETEEEERESASSTEVARVREGRREKERHERNTKRQKARRTMRANLGSDGTGDVGLMVTAAARFRRGSFSIATWAQRVRGETWPKVILHFFFCFVFLLCFLARLTETTGRGGGMRGRQGAR